MRPQRIRQLLRSAVSILSGRSPHHRALLTVLAFVLFLSRPVLLYAQADIRDLYERAANAFNDKQYQQAMDIYGQIVKEVPRFAPAYNGMALANQAAGGDEDKTIEYLKTAISYDPKLSQSYDNLGKIYYGREDIDHAQEYFEKALAIDPHQPDAELSLAWINLLVRSKPLTALKYFKMALSAGEDPRIYYGMGSAYFASNQRAQAMEMITKLHELGQEDLASRLEQSLRDHTEVSTTADANAANPANQHGLGPLPPTPDQPSGIQVRLRGKLSDY